MKAPLPFSFVLHLHQPVGNFDHVFADHANDVYRPFLDFLDERELWPIGLHVSGPLLEWLGQHDADLHDRIGRLADEGRVELLSAGWYEPILIALSREDRAVQLGWMREELASRFGVTPTGLWLTERVWEPDLPRDLAEAGIEYTLIDDHLARRAGVADENLLRPLITEAGGHRLDLLPIDERLRYLIPFRPAEEIEADLRRRHDAGEAMALLGDDGEKFGGWPRTREWLYEGGWLEDFGARMVRLREEGVVRLAAPAQIRREVAATGPVYLPSGSYPEMEGWAPGGHWKGFLARYDEANRLHKRMTVISRLCRQRGDPPEVRRVVGRAQCNDAYWHGVFGGLYMKHLREGVRRELAKAERMLRAGESLEWTPGDHAATGRTGWWAHGSAVSAWIDPVHGGTLTDLLLLEEGMDLVDVLTRRREAYHEVALRRGGQDRGAGSAPAPPDSEADPDAADEAPRDARAEAAEAAEAAPSIHQIEEGATLDRLPPVDSDVRALVRDRVLGAGVDFESYREGSFVPAWAPDIGRAEDPARIVDGQGRASLVWTFIADGSARVDVDEPARVEADEPVRVETEGSVRVETVIELREDGRVGLSWRWDPSSFDAEDFFAPELSLAVPVEPTFDPAPAEVWRYPIVTVSKCPDGFEEIEQGESVTPRWPASLGRASVTIGG